MARKSARVNWRILSAAMIAAGLALFAGANAHLVYVAFKSQPDCVPHAKASGEASSTAGLSAANSAC
jgi:hypothetical protein